MVLYREVVLFVVYSAMGWIYETIYCTAKAHKWENRGFLFGPVCPIYGTGAVAISLVMRAIAARGYTIAPWAVFIIAVVGSAVLEYTTSYVLEKLFHAVWWDYSSLPLNIHGRISLLTSLGFGAAGLLVVYGIAPRTESALGLLPETAVQILALLFTALLSCDATLTACELSDFGREVERSSALFHERMGALVDDLEQKNQARREFVAAERERAAEQIRQRYKSLSSLRRVRAFRYVKGPETLQKLLTELKEVIRSDVSAARSDTAEQTERDLQDR